jgi:hypothetical protein
MVFAPGAILADIGLEVQSSFATLFHLGSLESSVSGSSS